MYCMLKYYVYILFGDNLTSWLVQWSCKFEHSKWSTMYMPIWTVALHCSSIPVICSKRFLGIMHTLHHAFKFCDQAYYKSVIISQCQSETISLRWSIKIKIARDAQTHLVKYKITLMQALKLSWVSTYLLSTQHRDNRWCHSTCEDKLYK